MATREELKAEIERTAEQHGHQLGPWLDLGHASQVGCFACDRFAFVEMLPPPGKSHPDGLEVDCPAKPP